VTAITVVPKMRVRRKFLMDSAIYQTAAAPHLLDPIPRAVLVTPFDDPKDVDKRTKAAVRAARAEERRR
jgi:hypothetical protein